MAGLNQNSREELKQLCEQLKMEVMWEEPMSRHTSFKIGGPAKAMCIPQNRTQLAELMHYLRSKGLDSWFLGNGSNLLVSDDGLDGVVVLLSSDFDGEIVVDQTTIQAPAGKKLSAVCSAACRAGLTGLEFAWGIPGSVGGAVYMNAGAYGGEMKDRLLWVEYLNQKGEIVRLSAQELKLSYRHSCFMEPEYDGGCILRAAFVLQEGEQAEIQQEMDRIIGQRQAKQPLEYPSAGSTFKRPRGYFAGKLIEDAGLRGYAMGGARVSEKHCGFVINGGNATASDVMALCGHIRKTVMEQSGVELEMEVKRWGEF